MSIALEQAAQIKSPEKSPEQNWESRQEESRREARFNCRTTANNLQVLKKAASLAGLSVSQFVMNASLTAAYDLIQNRHHTVLSQQDWAMLTRIGENPAPPTEAMQELAAQHRARRESQR